jgi:hypothetical protein
MKTQNNVAAGAAGAGGNPAWQQNRVPATEIDSIRSYMFEEVEKKEVLHLDRLGADDIARAIEKLAIAKSLWIWAGSEEMLSMKLSEYWRVKIMRDGTVLVKTGDYVLVADDRFLLLSLDKDGFYIPIAKGDEITWDGTEELLSPSDLWRLIKDATRRVLEQVRWLWI